MDVRLTVREVETIPDGMSVRDYDQLDPEAREYVAELAQAETPVEVPPRIAAAFERRELIKYTVYLRIQEDDVSRPNRSL